MVDVRDNPLIKLAFAIASAAVVVAVLYFCRELLIPVALALLFCFLLTPAADFLERWLHVGRVVSSLFVVAAFFAAVGGFGWLVASQATTMVEDLPQYRERLVAKVRGLRDSFHREVARATETIETISKEAARQEEEAAKELSDPDADGVREIPPEETDRRTAAASPDGREKAADKDAAPAAEPVKVEVVPPSPDALDLARDYLSVIVHPIITLAAAAILLIFFLINRRDLRDRLIRLFGQSRIPATTVAFDDCSRRVMRFLMAQVFANCLVGVILGIGLYFLGIPNAVLWGALGAGARFFPYVGAMISTLMPFTVAFAMFDGWQIPLLVVAWCISLDLAAANILEPLLYGSRTGVSPTAILVSFMFWTWLWGGYGLFLATPITVCLLVIGRHIPAFESLHILLGDEPVLDPAARFYQRLIAGDADEALRIARESAKENGIAEACDHILLPGLAKVAVERRMGLLDDEKLAFARETAARFLEGIDAGEESPDEMPDPSDARIAIITGSGPFDPILTDLLARLARAVRVPVATISQDTLASEIVEHLGETRPGTVILAGIEPGNAARLRYLVKRLSAVHPSVAYRVVVFAGSKRASWNVGSLLRDTGQRQVTRIADAVTLFKNTAPAHPAEAAASGKP